MLRRAAAAAVTRRTRCADALRAVDDLLLDEGLADFSIERAARLSGISKTTIYKWWLSKGALALDGYFHCVETTLWRGGAGRILCWLPLMT